MICDVLKIGLGLYIFIQIQWCVCVCAVRYVMMCVFALLDLIFVTNGFINPY